MHPTFSAYLDRLASVRKSPLTQQRYADVLRDLDGHAGGADPVMLTTAHLQPGSSPGDRIAPADHLRCSADAPQSTFMDVTTEADEATSNQRVFDRLLSALLDTRRGQFALMRKGEIADFFRTPDSAYAAGLRRFPDCAFSVHEVCPPTIRAAAR